MLHVGSSVRRACAGISAALAVVTPLMVSAQSGSVPAPAVRADAAAVNAVPYVPMRTPDGRPDLQGIWDYRSATPLERPRDLADKAYFTAEEARAFEQRAADRIDATVAVHPPF